MALPDVHEPGTSSWLIERERRYGGMVTGVERRTISPFDPRQQGARSRTRTMQGGDRMTYTHHHYAATYARILPPLVARRITTVVEVGILTGVGLAVWCDLFPQARIIGLDIDLSHFEANRVALDGRGAFSSNEPEVYVYDQFGDDSVYLDGIIGDTVDLLVDDGAHSTVANVNSLRRFRDRMSHSSVYVIEDNPTCFGDVAKEVPHWRWLRRNGLVIGTSPKA